MKLPYGHTGIEYDFGNASIISSRIDALRSDKTGADIVRDAMLAPIGSPRLQALARDKKNAVLIISDHTRPVPSSDIVPAMLRELREGNPAIDITLLVATGCHRGTSEAELRSKLGDKILRNEKIVVHDAFDEARNVCIGTLPSGAPLVIDRLAAETELLVAEGFIEPHFFAGFSGGRKSVLPGICASSTVWGNHCGEFIDSPFARTGVLENNPIQLDMLTGARMAGLQYIVNVIIDKNHRTVAAFAGDVEAAHKQGTDFLRKYCEVEPVPADIVVTTNGGEPLDQNLYQCVKGLTAAEACVREGGTIILCAHMADGVGGDFFYRAMKECESPDALYEQYKQTPRDETIQDQWQTQILCRILKKHRVIFVTRKEMELPIGEMKMEYAPDIQRALNMAGRGEVTVIPDGVAVIVKNG